MIPMTMYSWIFRHRHRLEAIYGAPGRARTLRVPETRDSGAAGSEDRGRGRRLAIYELIPRARRRHAA